jgi:riboflavin transporter FmnP
MSNQKEAKKPNVQIMIKIALLSAIAFILTLEGIFRWRIPFFPSFLALDVSDIPALIGTITLGPAAGVAITAFKTLINVLLTGTISGGVGPVANFVFGCAFILPVGLIYRRFNRKDHGFVIGCVAGILVATTIAAFVNYFVLIPIFAFLFGGMDRVIGSGAAANDNIGSIFTLVLYAIIPFNLVKFTLVSIGGFVVYKAFKPVLAMLSKKQ